MRLIGAIPPIPFPSFIFFTVALVGLAQFPASYVMHHVNLGLGIGINEFIVVVGIPLLLVHLLRFDRRALFAFSRPRGTSWLPLAVLALGAVIIIDYLTAGSDAVIPLPQKYRTAMDGIMAVSSSGEFAYKFVLLCLIPGVCEEIFFRGYCQTSLAHHKGNAYAVLVTGALFALLHGNVYHIHLYFVLGCLISWTYAMSRTLWIPIAFHVFNNAWTFTNHTFGTTLPLKDAAFTTNAAVLTAGIILTVVGSMWYYRTR